MYHKSNFGSFGAGLSSDMNGYVPVEGDDPFAGSWDHGSESTHDAAGALTEYGEWWADERFPEIVAEAAEAAEQAEIDLAAWRAA